MKREWFFQRIKVLQYFWRLEYAVQNDYKHFNYGASHFIFGCPFFFIEIARDWLIWNLHCISSRIHVGWKTNWAAQEADKMFLKEKKLEWHLTTWQDVYMRGRLHELSKPLHP